MCDLLIEREYFPGGTNGVLSYRGKEICKTIELPWHDNQSKISCIPEGKYPVQVRESEEKGLHLIITAVPGRSNILIHPANNAETELEGCIAPVMKTTGEGKGVFSRNAMELLMHAIYNDLYLSKPVNLIIKSKTPGYEKEYNDPTGTSNQWVPGG